MLGFQQYKGIENISFFDSVPIEEKEVRRSSNADMLDLIYTTDVVTGFPTGALEQYLSDKTNDSVRQFIERNLLCDNPDNTLSVPSTLREDLLNLDSDFIVKTSRNKFESNEDYQERLQTYFNEIEQDKKLQSELKKLRAKYAKSVNSTD